MDDKSKKKKKLTIHINKVKYVIIEVELTGSQIKTIAGASTTDLLEEVIEKDGHRKRVSINNEQVVKIKSGLHFIIHPGGKDS